jgi:hypothetical protein
MAGNKQENRGNWTTNQAGLTEYLHVQGTIDHWDPQDRRPADLPEKRPREAPFSNTGKHGDFVWIYGILWVRSRGFMAIDANWCNVFFHAISHDSCHDISHGPMARPIEMDKYHLPCLISEREPLEISWSSPAEPSSIWSVFIWVNPDSSSDRHRPHHSHHPYHALPPIFILVLILCDWC